MLRASYNQYSQEIKEAIAFSENPNLFPDLNIPKSTAVSWIKNGVTAQVSKSTISLVKQEKLQQKVKLQKQQIEELKAQIKLIKKVSKILGTSLKNMTIKNSDLKQEIIETISDFQKNLTQEKALKAISLSKSKLKRWKDDLKINSSDSKAEYIQQYPMSITEDEFLKMKSLCEDKKYAHFPISSLHYYAKRENLLHCSLNTWYRFSKKYDFKRLYVKSYIKEYKEGIKTTKPNSIWHIDITEIKISNGRKYYLQTIVDNFSRYCIAWQIKNSKKALNSLELLKSIDPKKVKSLMMDKGTENTATSVTEFLKKFKIKRIIARFDVSYSNSIVESFFRSLKSNYLHFQKISSLKDLKSKIGFYINDYNTLIPHSAHSGLTPEEVYKKISKTKVFKEIQNLKLQSMASRKEAFYSSV